MSTAHVQERSDQSDAEPPSAQEGSMGCAQSRDAAQDAAGSQQPRETVDVPARTGSAADTAARPALAPPSSVALGDVELLEKPTTAAKEEDNEAGARATSKASAADDAATRQWAAGDMGVPATSSETHGMRRTMSATQPLDIASSGVSLRWFRRFFRENAATKPDITTREVLELFVKPQTSNGEVRYASLVPPADIWGPGKGTMYHIVHAWDTQFSTLVNRLNERFHKDNDSQVFLWLDLFAVNPWHPSECVPDAVRGQDSPLP